jgi:hypothetical protein
MSKKHSKRYVFTLTGVNINKVDQKYGIISTPILDEDNNIPNNTTKIDDLEIIKRTPENLSFLDESKRLRKCSISMIDFNSGKEVGSLKKKYKCFWDRNYIPDNIFPIGCPIKYSPSKARKTYHSEISKEKYTIVENITNEKVKYLLEKKDNRITIEKRDYYQTDGIFCSFNCCMAFILDPENKHNPMFRHSESLLLKMIQDFNEDTEEHSLEIIPAPHWRTLEEHGGHQSIEKFRESLNKVRYVDHGIIFNCIGRLYEDQIKF